MDPIVASFCGGAVGVLSALLVVEANNITEHSKEKCFYCMGTGYLKCGACYGKGRQLVSFNNGAAAGAGATGGDCRCSTCSGIGKVMCTSCLCTGKQLATEHDQRLDPWN